MSDDETMGIRFLNAELSSFMAGVNLWDGGVGNDFLGSVGASGIAGVPESGSTLTLLGLSLAGIAMLPWIRNRVEKLRFI
jgi:VPDSG-CTERM motif